MHQKISHMARLLKWIVVGLMGFLPLLTAAYWMLDGFPGLTVFQVRMIPYLGEAYIPALSQLSPPVKFSAFLVTLIPVGVAMLALDALRRLFTYYERLEIFSQNCVRCIRRFGWMLLVGQIIHPFYCGLISLVLTSGNPPGHRMLVVSIGLLQMGILAIAAAILLISWVMEEGRKLYEEQAATI
jgi:hypothetical protein